MLFVVAGAVLATLVIVAALRQGTADAGVPAAGGEAPAEVRAILAEEFPAGGDIPLWFALTNAAIESGFDPHAYNGQGRDDSYGLFQLNMLVAGTDQMLRDNDLVKRDLYDPRINAQLWERYWVKPFKNAAYNKGYRDDRLWEAIRLRLGGITWTNFDNATARQIKATFWATARRFRT